MHPLLQLFKLLQKSTTTKFYRHNSATATILNTKQNSKCNRLQKRKWEGCSILTAIMYKNMLHPCSKN
jgi:hypothetical protein